MTYDIRQLNAFLAVVQHGSLGRAAQRLNITQPALSRTIRRLEEQIGAPLFERYATGMMLTNFGQALLPHATLLQREAEQAAEEINALRGLSRGTIRVGAVASAVSLVLPVAIGRVLADPSAQAYKIARLSNFCGRWIRHSGWWPDHVLRLFKRGSARFTDAAVHESVQASGAVAVLDGHFLHYPYADLESMIAKVNRYSTDAAAMMHARGKTTSMPGVLGHAFWTLVRIYVIRRGFLDGKEGVILAVTAAAGSFFRYSKLWILNRNKSE